MTEGTFRASRRRRTDKDFYFLSYSLLSVWTIKVVNVREHLKSVRPQKTLSGRTYPQLFTVGYPTLTKT